jgi:hypothetical protein
MDSDGTVGYGCAYTLAGNPAISSPLTLRPEALRPRLATGLPRKTQRSARYVAYRDNATSRVRQRVSRGRQEVRKIEIAVAEPRQRIGERG